MSPWCIHFCRSRLNVLAQSKKNPTKLNPALPILSFPRQSVSHALKADPGSEVTLDETDGDSVLTDKVKLISGYLQQR